MNKLTTLCTSCILSMAAFSSSAQITLTAATSTPLPGDTSITYSLLNGQQGLSGSAVTWNFSNLTPADLDTLYYNLPGLGCSITPALHARGNYLPCYDLYSDNDSFNLVNIYAPGSGITAYNDDPKAILRFPLSYGGTQYVDSFFGASFGVGGGIYFRGDQLIYADAYGTLILPDSTYSNVLRVKTITHEGHMPDPNSIPGSYSSVETYNWYTIGKRTPLMSVRVNDPLSVSKLNEQENEVMVFPNPGKEHIVIECAPGTEINSTLITSISGQVVDCIYSGKGKNSFDIHLPGNMPGGLYFIRIETNKGIVVRKFEKE